MRRRGQTEELTREQFEDARRGFFGLLRRKRMSPAFIDQHGEDLFAQAAFEFSRQVAEGKRIENPGAWITTCGWNRTKTLLERGAQKRLVPFDSVAEPAADLELQPEEVTLKEERSRRIREAVGKLPDAQQRLLTFSYFEGESLRKAERRLGWRHAKAQRAHEAARKRLRGLLGNPSSRDELARLDLVLATFASSSAAGRAAAARLPERLMATARGALSFIRSGCSRSIELVRHPGADLRSARAWLLSGERGPVRVSEAGRRFLAGNGGDSAMAAAEGGSRLVEACKVGLACVVLSGGAVTGALLGSEHHRQHRVEMKRAAVVTPPVTDRVDVPSPTGGRASREELPATTPTSPTAPEPRGQQDHQHRSHHRSTPARRHSDAASKVATKKDRRAVEHTGTHENFGAVTKAAKEAESSPPEESVAQSNSVNEAQPEASATPAAPAEPPPTEGESADEQSVEKQFQGLLR